ncbi:MAG: hypothetical protein MK102_05695 [Fuerstiella sp.]|nr:hypothetical protein [Fuerstiella sp.]
MTAPSNDDDARRKYWSEQLEAGSELVQQLISFPVIECNEGFGCIRAAAEAADVEMLFAATKIGRNLDRIFSIRESLVDDVIAIGRDMNRQGWILKIEDGYRTLEMQTVLGRVPQVFDSILQKCIWECGGEIPHVEFVFRRAMVLTANIPKTGTHLSGSAIDISVFRRDDGEEVWRGGPYPEMSERTPMRSPFVSDRELKNRLKITDIMESHGFMHYPFEYWHYNKGDAAAHILTGNSDPARYGPVNWDSITNTVTAVSDPMQPLHSLAAIDIEIRAAMDRLR